MKNLISEALKLFEVFKNFTKKSELDHLGIESTTRLRTIAFGAHVSQTFRDRIVWTADHLNVHVNHLMAVIAFETNSTFRANIKNLAGSGAIGLIQFMPTTAKGLGTTTEALAKMSPESQINYVYKYFLPYKGQIKTLGDIYMAVLWPAAIGKPDDYVLWDKATRPTTYRQNAGLDKNKDAVITKHEAYAKIEQALNRGLEPQNAWTGEVNP